MPHEWYPRFFEAYTACYPRDDWPMDQSDRSQDFWRNWRLTLKLKGIGEGEAYAAMPQVAFEHPKYLDAHLAALIAIVLRDRQGAKSTELSPLDHAMAESRDCPDCHGQPPAAAIRWSHDRTHRAYGYSAAFRCCCPLGRYLHEQDRLLPPEKRLNMAFLGEFPHLQLRPCPWGVEQELPGGGWGTPLDNPQRYAPNQWDEAAGCPVAYSTGAQFDRAGRKAREEAARRLRSDESLAVTADHEAALATLRAGPFPKPESERLRGPRPAAYADTRDPINADEFVF